jgi:hypothetical protein
MHGIQERCNMAKKPTYHILIRKYLGEPKPQWADIWFMQKEGVSEFALMHGSILTARIADFRERMEAMEIEVKVEKRRLLPQVE